MIMTKNEDEIIFITPGNKAITIGENVKTVGSTLLQSQKLLTNLTVNENNTFYKAKDGVLYSHDFKQVIAVCGGVSSVIVDSLVEIFNLKTSVKMRAFNAQT